jgi:long-chain acyl-CoA synthetase
MVFQWGYASKRGRLQFGQDPANAFWDNVVFTELRKLLGGRVRYIVTGSAPISTEVYQFLQICFGCPVLQGYGLTETCGMCAVLAPEFYQYGVVGLIMPSVECKLVDVPEAGYFSTNNPPQGEVFIRGNSVIKGYYKRDDLNNDESIFTKDEWFRTGDVGQFNADGTISIIDRIKNLVKLAGGEYIALERLESIYKACDLVSNICVHASTDAKQPIAIIVPHEQHLRHALSTAGISGVDPKGDIHALCANSEVKAMVMKACNALGKKNQFKTMELLEAVILDGDEWTPESGLLTAAQKVQRRKVAEKFDKEIKEIYKNQ